MCLGVVTGVCCDLSAQEFVQRDAIRRIERDYTAGEADRRLIPVTLRARATVSITSNLIRLGDVVEPVDPDMPGWEEMSRLGVGLVPIDGTEMVIERDRLEPFIHNGHKKPVLIRWMGPENIRVKCQAVQRQFMAAGNAGGQHPDSYAKATSASEILRASATSPLGGSGNVVDGSLAASSFPEVNPQHLGKVKRWILGASSAVQGGSLAAYDFEIVEIEKIRPTKRVLDVAVLGPGLIQVSNPVSKSPVYVPAGALEVDDNGNLVVRAGDAVMPLYPVINIPADTDKLRVKSGGAIEVRREGQADWTTAGTIVVNSGMRQRAKDREMQSIKLVGLDTTPSDSAAVVSSDSWQVLQGFLESPGHEAVREFETISGIETVTCLHRLREGLCRFRLQGRGLDGPIDLVLGMNLTAKPVVVAPRKSFPRGHRLGLNDLHLIPIEGAEVDETQFVSMQQLVGMEVSKGLRLNRPILKSDVRQPTLVHRGELLDLRVVGAGIVITTAAKAIEDGPLNGLVEVETLRPRKRKIARVVASGVVEILSRPPQVGNLLENRQK